MPTLNSPVELPTERRSFVEFPMTANIQDPTSWDVLPSDGDITRHNSGRATTSANTARYFATTSSRPSSKSPQSIRARDSPAMEIPPQELEAQPLSYFPPRQSSAQVMRSERSRTQNAHDTGSDTGHLAQSSDDYTSSTSSASTAGTSSLQGNQVYSIPPSTMTKEENVGSPMLHSPRTTSNPSKKTAVPTSKYKRKPPPSLKSSVRPKSGVETPLDSPTSVHTQLMRSPTPTQMVATMPSELPASVTPTSIPPPPPEPHVVSVQAPLLHAKSTASVRKARALHSHPSMPTLRVEPVTSPPLPPPSRNPSIQRSRKSVDTIRSRPSLYELQQPTPAPTTPLPDLPIGAQRMSRSASRDVVSQPMPPPDVHVRPGTSSSTIAPTLRRQDTSTPVHAEMANFMVSNSKIVFRRFHDVHIRLLLTLQDEISTLEKELAKIENVKNSIDAGQEIRRVKILSELRKLMAEYDHLFSNWNLMQASKADSRTREELEQFLLRQGASPTSPTSTETVEDLLWLQIHSDDISCVDLSTRKDKVTVAQTEIMSEKQQSTSFSEPATTRATGGGGGFAALFASCAGKRK